MKTPFYILAAFTLTGLAHAQPRPTEIYRFELEMNTQSCTRPDGGDYVCGQDGTRSLIEVALDEATPDALEDRALEGTSEQLGLGLSPTVQYRPQVTVRKSFVAGTAIYTVRFHTQRTGDDAPKFETIYIEDGDQLTLPKPLTLMADRMGNSPRYFRQVFFTLGKLQN